MSGDSGKGEAAEVVAVVCCGAERSASQGIGGGGAADARNVGRSE